MDRRERFLGRWRTPSRIVAALVESHPPTLTDVQGEAWCQPGVLRFVYYLSLGQIHSGYG